MSGSNDYDLQIVITAGRNDIEKATLGFAFACATSGANIVVYLSMRAAEFAVDAELEIDTIPNFKTIGSYLDTLIEQGATIEACHTCTENYGPKAERTNNMKHLKSGISYAGISSTAIRALQTPTIVF